MKKLSVVARTGRGNLTVIEEGIPVLGAGSVLIEVHRSLVSPGTELGGGWAALRREKQDPNELAEPQPIGYSNAGVVVETGRDVTDLPAGTRVAAIGAGYARHATFAVVPRNLVFPLPGEVSFEQGSFAMLAATALHGLRRTSANFGEYVAVLGLGLVGQISAQLFQLAGQYVIGWDLMDQRVAVADKWGINQTCLVGHEDPVKKSLAFTNGHGLDAGVIAIAGEASAAMQMLENSMKVSADGHKSGVITIVGGVHFDYNSETTNIDYRRASRTGPGYHDEAWEKGRDYPSVFVRWDTRSNVNLCFRLIAEGKLNVDTLITHSIEIDRCEESIDWILDTPENILGVVFKMK